MKNTESAKSANAPLKIASLQMYDLPYINAANDRLWAEIACRLKRDGIDDVPPFLTRVSAVDEVWHHPRMLLSQTCGYPLLTALQDRVKLVATPRYNCQGCTGPNYRSAIVVRVEDPAPALIDLRGSRCAVNDVSSNSGMNLLRAAIAPLAKGQPFFRSVLVSGSHVQSLEAVAQRQADVAAIDCITFAHVARSMPDIAAAVRVIAWTDESASLPIITAASTDERTVNAIRQALYAVANDPSLRNLREDLLIDGFDVLDRRDYQQILALEQFAAELGYPHLL